MWKFKIKVGFKDKKLFIEENRFYFEEFDKMKAKFFPNEDIEYYRNKEIF